MDSESKPVITPKNSRPRKDHKFLPEHRRHGGFEPMKRKGKKFDKQGGARRSNFQTRGNR